MKTLRGWGGLARTSLDPPQYPHYRDAVEGPSHVSDEVPRCELGGYNKALVRRGDVTVWLSSEAIAAWTPRWRRPARRPAAVLGSRHRDRPDPATPLPSPAASGRRVPARPVRDDAPRPLRPRLYDALPAQSASEAPFATGPARRGQAPLDGVVARIVMSPHDAHRQDPHLPMRYDTGRPRAVIRFKISQPRTASLPCPAGLRARRPSPIMDL